MILLADTHVHIYPNYSLDVFLNECFRKILMKKEELNSKIISCICLTEVVGCDFYLRLTNTELRDDFTLEEFDNFKVIKHQGELLFIFPGFQTNTEEKIEVLELFTKERVQGGISLEETISKISKKGALPVVSWSFGKWLGKRGEIINKLIEKGEHDFALGDSALRFIFHPTPRQFKFGKNRIIYGSDPLPLKGEEVSVFDYFSLYNDFSTSSSDREEVAKLIKETICSKNLKFAGKRNFIFKFLKRWLGVMLSKG